MSTATTEPRGQVPGVIDISQTERVPFSRLVRAELRKMVDTRSGFWLLLVTGLLLFIVAGIVLLVIGLNDDVELGAGDISGIMTIPLSLLVPVLAIQAVGSEWSQRTALVTFSLEPHRIRLLMAKLTSVVILALATIVLAMIVGSLLNVVAAGVGGYDVRWDLDWEPLLVTVVSQLLYFLMAFGLAMVLLSTPVAVAVFYVVALMLPLMVYGILYSVFEWAQDVIPFIDLQYASAPFFEDWSRLEGVDWAAMISAVLIWVVVPFVVGIRRVLSTEPK